MPKYTVVLLRPEVISDDYPIDTYTAHVEAANIKEAIREAQIQVFKGEEVKPRSTDEYKMLLVFRGHQEPIAFGWQTGYC